MRWTMCCIAGLLTGLCVGCNEPSNQAALSPPTGSLVDESVAEPAEDSIIATEPLADPIASDVPADGNSSEERSPASEETKPALPKPAPPKTAPPLPTRSSPKTQKVALAVPPQPEYVFEPRVRMSDRDAATCLIKVGDAFPDGVVSDREGQEVATKQLLGERLTLVVFWSNSNRPAREQIERLPLEITEPFKDTGLNVLAVNVGDELEQAADILPVAKRAGIHLLHDSDRSLFAKVATERIPRTYLLDKEGKVLWLDIEYSRATARELTNAIHVYLGNRVPSDS